jgi:hypothetical protein
LAREDSYWLGWIEAEKGRQKGAEEIVVMRSGAVSTREVLAGDLPHAFLVWQMEHAQ